ATWVTDAVLLTARRQYLLTCTRHPRARLGDNLGFAADDDPVLIATLVQLIRKLGARVNAQAFHFVVGAIDKHVKPAPWPHLEHVFIHLRSVRPAHRIDQAAHFLTLAAASDE